MRYNKVRKMDISNGPGVRVSVFVQGCTFNCKNCFNPETHDFNGGKEFTEEIMDKIVNLCESDTIRGLSILGGDPLHPKNIEGTILLSKKFKEKFPNKDLWIWTGFLYENIVNKDILNYADVIIDGQYVDELHSFLLKYCGSSNQRIIDVKKTLKENKIVELEEK